MSGGVVEHLNLFPLEESSEKKGNAEYLKDQKDEKVTFLSFCYAFPPLPVFEIKFLCAHGYWFLHPALRNNVYLHGLVSLHFKAFL